MPSVSSASSAEQGDWDSYSFKYTDSEAETLIRQHICSHVDIRWTKVKGHVLSSGGLYMVSFVQSERFMSGIVFMQAGWMEVVYKSTAHKLALCSPHHRSYLKSYLMSN